MVLANLAGAVRTPAGLIWRAAVRVGGDESWRTLLQCFRTKLFLATSDEFTSRIAAELYPRQNQQDALTRMRAHPVRDWYPGEPHPIEAHARHPWKS